MRRDAGWAFILFGNIQITRRFLHTFLLLQENFGFINRSLEAASSSWGYLGFKLPHDDTILGSGAFYLNPDRVGYIIRSIFFSYFLYLLLCV